MSSFYFLLFGLSLCFCSPCSSFASDNEIRHRNLADSFCPLNFNVLRKVVSDDSSCRPCQYGPTDSGNAECLFSLDFTSTNANNRKKKTILCAASVGFGLEMIGGDSTWVKFTFEEIKKATMNFSRENIVGKGGYGNVYKGLLKDGSEVALKRFKNCSAAGDATFAHEVEVIASISHVNLVAFKGYCTTTVHSSSGRVAGTLGYVAPEYALYGQLTERTYVYGFGVVLLELLSGKKAVISIDDHHTLLLTDWAWSLVEEVLSSHSQLYARPTMDQIVRILETDFPGHSIPKLSFFLSEEVDDGDKSANFSSLRRMSSANATEKQPCNLKQLAMGQQRAEVTESLLVRQGHGNFVYSEENGGVGLGLGGGGSVAASTVTTILVLSTFVVACIAFGFGCALGYSSPTQFSIMEDLGLSVAEFSLFGSILSIGAILGAAISGKITDLLGRKLTMWILNLFYFSGWLAITFTKVPWLLDLGRLSLGFTNGISGYLVTIYIAEITPKNVRGRFSAIVPLMVCWGMSFMYVVGSFVNWRTLALIAIIPGLLQLPLLFFIPESPRWLAKVGHDKELEASLLCLRGEKADISDEATDIKDYVKSLKSFSEKGILDVFQKKYVRPLLTVVGLMALSNLGGINAFAYYSGVIFVSAGISSMVGLITLAAAQTLLGILGAILIDKSGRRPLLLVASAGLCFSSFLTGLSFFLKEFNWWDQGSPILALIGLLMYMGSYVVASGIPWLLVSEVCHLF
ncbi:hypothetical protein CRYUN_Cryun05aG0017200 [Craigia yunnanensis]